MAGRSGRRRVGPGAGTGSDRRARSSIVFSSSSTRSTAADRGARAPTRVRSSRQTSAPRWRTPRRPSRRRWTCGERCGSREDVAALLASGRGLRGAVLDALLEATGVDSDRGSVVLRGTIDCLVVRADGTVVVVEFKSGPSARRAPAAARSICRRGARLCSPVQRSKVARSIRRSRSDPPSAHERP